MADAAVAIADAEGLAALTLSRLAAQLGVRTPSLYHHVDGLDGARRAVALRGLRDLGTALRDAAVGRSGPDALRAVADAYRAYALAHPGAYAATQRVVPAEDDELRAAAARATEVVFAVVRHWEDDEEELVHLVRAVRSALHGFVLLESGGGFGMPAPRDASFARLVDVQRAGLDAHAAGRPASS
ncbi:TetR-like C-terminal domain-containing protein [Patulibacter minatonensis]|uniref:TetR-like C-terminal domain-containing protein n=1 Tax=Patulibacter minatonensis TaxID=298163 RepID=UPI00047DCC80|nr:TetR-like C-terminal domain-containing protein [Patulibacter minatonensis]